MCERKVSLFLFLDILKTVADAVNNSKIRGNNTVVDALTLLFNYVFMNGIRALLINIVLSSLSILPTIGQKGRKGKNFERVYIKKKIDKKKV